MYVCYVFCICVLYLHSIFVFVYLLQHCFINPTPLRECGMSDEGHSLTFSPHFPRRCFNLVENLSMLLLLKKKT